MGCRTEPAVHIAHVLQSLHFFQFFKFFFSIYTTYRKEYVTLPYRKNKKFIFFENSHDLQQKKNYTHLQQEKLHD